MSKTDGITEQTINELRCEEECKLRDVLDAKLLKSPASYEWGLRLKEPLHDRIFGAILSMIAGGLFIYMGVSKVSIGTIIFGIIFTFMLLGMTRYLFSPDKDLHYKLTPLGIIYTEKDTIPDVAYTIMRGFAWFSAVACLATVIYVGPLAFVGAGGMALLAVKFTGFHAVTKTVTVQFAKDYKIKTLNKAGIMCLCSQPVDIYCTRRIHYEPNQEAELLEALSQYINIEQVIKVKGHRALGYYD
ncbi:hypothetical protein HWV03_11845 [Moritella sp. 36]|uniref:hypothetical protein n=1 Tax=Moritella sp. 36 TaxID=2746233 RepID=UPI001BA88B7C|nr:hypothetical protein [Moritella sp. 36]QUM89441.1 hypothetical protein HWV03_11845 [Moritella sp. 36]